MTEPSRIDHLRHQVAVIWLAGLSAINGINIRLTISGVLELLGIAAIIWGFYLIAPFLGFIIGGIGLLIIGRAIDPPIKESG